MAITTPGKIAEAASTVIRDDVTIADSATINDTNFPPADAVECSGVKSVLIFPRFTGGTAPTATVIPLYRCGSEWAVGTATSALAEGVVAVVNTYGRRCFFRISAISGSPTSVDLHCSVAEPFKYDGPARG